MSGISSKKLFTTTKKKSQRNFGEGGGANLRLFSLLPKIVFCPLSHSHIDARNLGNNQTFANLLIFFTFSPSLTIFPLLLCKSWGGAWGDPDRPLNSGQYIPPPLNVSLLFSDVSVESALERIAISPKLINAPINILDISGQ